MSKLQELIEKARSGLSAQENISDAGWQAIATQCGAAELAEIQERILKLRAELEIVEEWDGDTQDDLYLAISTLTRLMGSVAVALSESKP
ncbi:hypothetical protein J3P84_05410 [Pseudomonas sp. Z1-29]|uniref:hypothetical protein n=1 Tax=unclassified Pseudomonas TaxID=196821 RepID=UPI003DA9C36D